MEFKDYYKILGVDSDADIKAIKTAYRKLARKYHPDVSEHQDAEAQFKEVAEAYEVLKNSEKRAEYDEIRDASQQQGFRPPPGSSGGHGDSQYQGDFADFFSSIFGDEGGPRSSSSAGRRPFSQRGQDIETELPIFLEDTLSDASKEISYHLPRFDTDGRITEVKKTLKVKIPAGVADGERIRLKGQGGLGIGESASGDLYIRVRLVPHPLFDVEGHNLIITLPIAPWEAALGAKVTLPTLSGKIQLTIPANSQSGQRMRIKGKGLPGKQVRGDLYAVLRVVMPPASNEVIKDQWQKLAELAPFDPRAEWSEVA